MSITSSTRGNFTDVIHTSFLGPPIAQALKTSIHVHITEAPLCLSEICSASIQQQSHQHAGLKIQQPTLDPPLGNYAPNSIPTSC